MTQRGVSDYWLPKEASTTWVGLAVVAAWHHDLMTKPPRLQLVDRVDLPVVEASGLAAMAVGDEFHLAVVGDRTSDVAVASYSAADGLSAWQMIDLSTLDGWSMPATDSQLEAIAVDGGHLVAMMREDPPVVLVADTASRRLRCRIALTAPPGSPLAGFWDDPSSRGEGLVLLRGGRLLVAKEKRPQALVEFSPAGVKAQGLSKDDFLDPGESWDAPDGDVDYRATSLWEFRGEAGKHFADVSAIAVTSDRALGLLSDQSRTIGRIELDEALPPVGGAVREVCDVWRLPKKAKKPEGMAALPDRRLLIALDTGSTQRNGMIVVAPT